MKKYDVAVIGGGPAGVQAAISARNTYPDKSIVLIRKEKKTLIPCGIPYVFSSLASVDEDILPDDILRKNGIDLIVGEVIDRNGKTIELSVGEKLSFQKLVIATGSTPIVPKIPGINLPGVYTLTKHYEDLVELRRVATAVERILIVGGGFVGVELADELLRAGKSVVIAEQLPSLLPGVIDAEFAEIVRGNLEMEGADVRTGTKVAAFLGDSVACRADLEDGQFIEFDVAIVSVGFSPNTTIARRLGLAVDERFGVLVDECMRTSDSDIYAAGDCTAHRDCYTGNYRSTMLASAATSQGRLAGANLFMINLLKIFPGVLGSFATKVANIAVGVTGLTEKQAQDQGIEYVVGKTETVDHHPGKLPHTSKIVMKLIFARNSHVLLGAQVLGGDTTGEIINMLSVAIQNKMTEMDIDTIQIGTHPLLTASPLAYPVITASVDAIMKWYREPVSPEFPINREILIDPNLAGSID